MRFFTVSHDIRCFAVAIVLSMVGCADSPKDVGEECSADRDCITRLCHAKACMNPLADDDADGVTNAIEVALGANPLAPDTDDDGLGDRSELGPEYDGIDTDGDGKFDILESIRADSDGDCIVDQVDARDGIVDTDLRPMVPVVCSVVGLCADRSQELAVQCGSGVAACVYDGVEGFNTIEIRCDGIDENCDGVADDGFEDRNDNGVADCRERRRFDTPFVTPVSAAGDFANREMRLQLVVGRPVRGAASDGAVKIEMGLPPGNL